MQPDSDPAQVERVAVDHASEPGDTRWRRVRLRGNGEDRSEGEDDNGRVASGGLPDVVPLDILKAAQSRGQKGFAFEDAREGDWIEVGQMSAYSAVVSTDFNSLKLETFIAVDEPPFHL